MIDAHEIAMEQASFQAAMDSIYDHDGRRCYCGALMELGAWSQYCKRGHKRRGPKAVVSRVVQSVNRTTLLPATLARKWL